MLRMFPLGSVLFPHMLIPLHIFEPRYVQLVEECLAADEPFGVVLIERGFEVGGGDARFTMGTEAAIVDNLTMDDGRMAIAVVGTERIQIDEWLEDAPYPRANVTAVPDQDRVPSTDSIRTTQRTLRRLLALMSELGTDVGPLDYELSENPKAAVYQLASLAPVGPLDRQTLLESTDAMSRLDQLDVMLADAVTLVENELG